MSPCIHGDGRGVDKFSSERRIETNVKGWFLDEELDATARARPVERK